jgi:hypothetical protein
MKVKFGAITTGEAIPDAGELGHLTVTDHGAHTVVGRLVPSVWTEESYPVAVRQVPVDCLSPEFVSREDPCRWQGIGNAVLDRVLHSTSAAPAPTPPNAQTPPAA